MTSEEYTQRPNFLATLAGLMVTPRETTESLLQDQEPPYAGTIILCVVLTFWVPALTQSARYGYDLFENYFIFRLTFIFAGTLLLFIPLELVLLRSAFRIQCTYRVVFSCIAYSCAPAILCAWLMLLFNYLISGRLTLVTMIIFGFGHPESSFLTVIPYACYISMVLVILVYTYTLQAVGQLGPTSTLVSTFLSGFPLAIAFLISLLFCEIVWPGTLKMLNESFLPLILPKIGP